MSSLGDALKGFRRGVHVHGEGWRCVVITRPKEAMRVFLDEVVPTLQGGSLKVEQVQAGSMFVKTEKGGHLFVRAVNDLTDAYLLAGQQLTHIIWLHLPPMPVQEYIRAMLRSNTVPHNQLREDTVTI